MKELKLKFNGKGQVLGYLFTQLKKSPYSYLYEVKNEDSGAIHYEVFRRKENTQFECVSYPREKAFGIWAWTCNTLQGAEDRYDELNNEISFD